MKRIVIGIVMVLVIGFTGALIMSTEARETVHAADRQIASDIVRGNHVEATALVEGNRKIAQMYRQAFSQK